MGQWISNLLVVLIAVIIIQGCSESSLSLDTENVEWIEFRGGVEDCRNWITNGKFDDHTYNGIADCDRAFQNNLVANWAAATNTPDLHFSECVPFLGSELITEDYAVLAAGSNSYYESIEQTLVPTPPHDLDIVYHLCVLANGAQGDSPLHVTTHGATSELVVDEQIGDHGDVGQVYDIEFTTAASFNRITFASKPDATSVIIDDLVLTCSSTNFKTILFSSMQNSCQFEFEPYISGSLNAVSYSWDFGDGSTSALEKPTHTYNTPGIYRVSLTIVDDRKCCTKREVEVECTDKPLCYSYICWEQFIGQYPCAKGVTFVLPNGVQQYVPFVEITSGNPTCMYNQPYPIPAVVLINGGYCDIHEQLEFAAQSIGYDLSVHTYDRYGNEDCFKAGIPDSGIFTSSADGLKILSIKGKGIFGSLGSMYDCDHINEGDILFDTYENCSL